jgi:hypothetical protein
VVGVCDYGIEVSCVVERGNVMGTQFHPEKSSASGMALLANFTAVTKRSMAAKGKSGVDGSDVNVSGLNGSDSNEFGTYAN